MHYIPLILSQILDIINWDQDHLWRMKVPGISGEIWSQLAHRVRNSDFQEDVWTDASTIHVEELAAVRGDAWSCVHDFGDNNLYVPIIAVA